MEEKLGNKAGGRIRVESSSFGSSFNEYPFHLSLLIYKYLLEKCAESWSIRGKNESQSDAKEIKYKNRTHSSVS